MKLYIKGEKVSIKPIDNDSISILHLWYQQPDFYGFATGGKKAEDVVQADSNSFASGIFTNDGTSCIGLVIGEIKKAKETVLWIRTFLVDFAWQRKQIGTHSFNLLCSHAAQCLNVKKVYLSVFEENRAGINFWTKMGMSCIKTLRFKESERNYRVLIFEKVL